MRPIESDRTANQFMKTLKYIFLFVDISFIIYWLITLLHIIPSQYLYSDYQNPILVDWNWSFFPLDILVSASGLLSLHLARKGRSSWRSFALISLILTSTSGLQAIAFWTLRKDFELNWWLPNLFLLIYPLFFIPRLVASTPAADHR